MTKLTISLSDLLTVLEESSLGDLDRSASSSVPTRKRQHSVDTVRLGEIRFVPGEGNLLVKCFTSGETGKQYDTQIMLNDVVYSEEQAEGTINFTAMDGEEYFIQPLSAQETQVEVTCNCMDFYWRFALWNHNDGSLLGPKPQPYYKKTDRPPVNPEGAPGMCKHLMKLATGLMENGIVR
jgi:hypothetical protein